MLSALYDLQNKIDSYYLTCERLPELLEVETFLGYEKGVSTRPVNKVESDCFHIFGAYIKVEFTDERLTDIGKTFVELMHQCLKNFDDAMYYESKDFLYTLTCRMSKDAINTYNTQSGIIYNPNYGLPFDYLIIMNEKFAEIQVQLFIGKSMLNLK